MTEEDVKKELVTAQDKVRWLADDLAYRDKWKRVYAIFKKDIDKEIAEHQKLVDRAMLPLAELGIIVATSLNTYKISVHTFKAQAQGAKWMRMYDALPQKIKDNPRPMTVTTV